MKAGKHTGLGSVVIDRDALGVYRRLLAYVRPHWKVAAVAVACMVFAGACQAAFAWIIRPLVDGSFIDQDPTLRLLVPLGLMLLFLVNGVLTFVSDYGVAYVGRHVVKRLRGEVFEHYLKLPSSFYDHSSPGMLLSKLTYDIEQVANATSQAVIILVRDTFTIVFLVAYMFWISGWLALIFLGLGPVLTATITHVNKRFRKISRRIQSSVGNVAQIAEDGIHGHREVKIFGGQTYERNRFEETNERNRRQSMRYVATKAVSTPLVQFFAATALSVVLYLATLDEVMQAVTPGAFISFVAAMLLLMPPIKRLVNVNSQMQKGIAAGSGLFALLDQPAEPDHGTLGLNRAKGKIEFRNVRFAYDSAAGDVLQDISMTIESGETVALVGRSGSGKTTLASLVPRFYEPADGQILVDDVPIQEYRLADLRAQIALVNQQVVLFNDTLSGNISYGSRERTDPETIRQAADAAYAVEFIDRLPQGFDTIIGENGVLLSGGQRQRLAIARALLKDAPILILDEATSALDSESELQIQSALDGLMKGRTTLVIAHRLSTIENADRIVVMAQGRIVESGTHQELLRKGGHYAGLHRIQFSETVEG
ncbi:MAG: lipid A export permease/ATP-binding protein MsbA [Aquisalimonadaceae bacterium]